MHTITKLVHMLASACKKVKSVALLELVNCMQANDHCAAFIALSWLLGNHKPLLRRNCSIFSMYTFKITYIYSSILFLLNKP